MISNKNIRRLRDLHRDLGYFFVGITLVYALSGIFLTHKHRIPTLETQKETQSFPKHLNKDQFNKRWNRENNERPLSSCIDKNKEFLFYIQQGKGHYNKSNGLVNYETYHQRRFVQFLNQLHYNNKTGWPVIADLFAIVLIFFAISGLLIVRGKNGFKRRGIWLMLAGFIVVVVYAMIS